MWAFVVQQEGNSNMFGSAVGKEEGESPPPPQGRTPWADVAFWTPPPAGGCLR